MSAFIELNMLGDHRVYVEASSIKGIISSVGMDSSAMATPDCPMNIVLQGGDLLEGIYGVSPWKLVLYVAGARKVLQLSKTKIAMLITIDNRSEFENEIVAAAQHLELTHGGTA